MTFIAGSLFTLDVGLIECGAYAACLVGARGPNPSVRVGIRRLVMFFS